MKPECLIISGWGPYAEEESIEFQTFMEQGIFLITGPTGAGKTTIFDAIAYALYGSLSGGLRDKNSVRSDFAKPKTDTYVELFFEHGGRHYHIRRSPRYERLKKTGTGTVLTSESADFAEVGHKVIAGVQETGHAVLALLGLNHIQFKQVSMIAQGEFLDILTSSSAERSLVFRRLFQTERYDRLAEKLSERAKELERTINECLSGMEEATAAMTAAIDRNDAAERRYDRICEKAEIWIGDRKKEVRKLAESLESEEKAIRNSIILLEQAKQREKLQKRQLDLREKLDLLEQKKTDAVNRLPEAESLEEQAQRLLTENRSLKDLIPLYRETEELRRSFEKQKAELSQEMDRRSGLEKKLLKLEQKLTFCETEQERCRDTEQRLKETEANSERLERRRDDLELAFRAEQRLSEDQKKLELLQADYEKNTEESNRIKKIFEEKEESCKRNVIGLSARFLKPGEPCPVCGSTEHPSPAGICADAADETEVKRWKKKYEQAAGLSEKAYESAAAMKGRVDQEQPDFLDRLSRLELKRELRKGEIDKLKNEAERACKDIHILMDQLSRELKDRNENERMLAQLRHDRACAEEDSKKTAAVCAELKGRLDQLQGRLSAGIERRPAAYPDITALEERLLETENGRRTLLEAAGQIRSSVQTLHSEMERLIALCQQAEQELRDWKGSISADEAALRLGSHETQKQKLLREREDLLIELRRNEEAAASVMRHFGRFQKLNEEYGIVKDLDLVTRGNNPERVVFEQYILALYFEDVLEAANLRLVSMTSDRYELRRVDRVMDGRTKNFLELEVMDYYTGKKRSVKTLSGGEAFKAALALALGLSDVIQSNAGGIRVDTLFIDEGFGGLDSESLDQALNELVKLGRPGRLVGIISHVAELKERIPGQLIIDRTNAGSSIREITAAF